MHDQLDLDTNLGRREGVRDISQLLNGQYVILTGGRSNDGCPIITFPDESDFNLLTDEEYRKLITYLTSVPSLQDSDLGFALIVDRRKDKWNAVKTVLVRISAFFPGVISVVYVIRPEGFFQKALSEVSNKLFRDEFQFKVVICSCDAELHTYIQKDQLTKDLGGFIHYDHQEWIEQRVAVERFSAKTQVISSALRTFTQCLQGTELPNDVESCEKLLETQKSEYDSIKSDLVYSSQTGESLLTCIRFTSTTSSNNDDEGGAAEGEGGTAGTGVGVGGSLVHHPERLINVTAIERLLVQLEETERTFSAFWESHEKRLIECLDLRRFEAEFKELQPLLEECLSKLSLMTEVGDSVSRIDCLLLDLHDLYDQNSVYLDRASSLEVAASDMIENDHYAVDSVRPKCIELIRMKEKFQSVFESRLQSLQKSRKLREKLEKANHWCTNGVELLASQQIERYQSHKMAEECLNQLEDFLTSPDSNIVSAFREMMNATADKSVPSDTKALVHQVLKRVEDVTLMCEKRKTSLKKLTTRLHHRPIHAVTPEPAIPLQHVVPSLSSPGSCSYGGQSSTMMYHSGGSEGTGSDPTTKSFGHPFRKISLPSKNDLYYNSASSDHQSLLPESLKARRGHVLKELLETERIYVTELCSILKGYKDEMLNPEMQTLLPISLFGKSDVLFGNLEEIFRFHNDVFLRDLENCIDTPELIGLCFVQRKDTFHSLYSFYCQNKPQSEELRRQVGDSNSFFIECQMKLGHKLPLSAYLLKPVQRITKYQLLLKDLLESQTEETKGRRELEEAVGTMLNVLKCLNDSMHQISITGFLGNLGDMGKLLMQGSFCVWNDKKSLKDLRLKPAQRRHLFLYEKALLFTKRSGKSVGNEIYQYKNSLMMSQIGLTESVKSDPRKFEVWLPGRHEVYTVLPQSLEVKETWVKEIKRVLLDQFEYLKGESIKQYSTKRFQKGSSFSGSPWLPPAAAAPLSPTSKRSTSVSSLGSEGSKTTSNTSHEDNDTIIKSRDTSLHSSSEGGPSPSLLLPSLPSSSVAVGATFSSGNEPFDDVIWCEDFSQSEDDEATDGEGDGEGGSGHTDDTEMPCSSRFLVLADYNAMGSCEVTLREGDHVDLIKVGCAGWWYVKVRGTPFEGWAPAAYLERVVRRRSSPSSVVSESSTSSGGPLRRGISRSSLASASNRSDDLLH